MGKKKATNKQLDLLTTIIGIGMPVVSLPQLYTVITAPDVRGVSFLTWAFFTLQAGVFAIFAVKNKQKPLVLTYIPLFIVELAIVIVLFVRTY